MLFSAFNIQELIEREGQFHKFYKLNTATIVHGLFPDKASFEESIYVLCHL